MSNAGVNSPAVTDMDWTQKLSRLRDLLAERYYDKDETFRLVESASLPPDKIRFDDRAVANWHNIVEAAVSRGKLGALVEVCIEDSGDVKLRKAYKDYLSEPQAANRTAPLEVQRAGQERPNKPQLEAPTRGKYANIHTRELSRRGV
jgi:hypothetical protein